MPDEILAMVEAAIADAGLTPSEILRSATQILATLAPAVWAASVLTKDSRIATESAAGEADGRLGDAARDWAARMSLRVIDSGDPLMIQAASAAEFADLAIQGGAVMVPMRTRYATLGTLAWFAAGDPSAIGDADLGWIQSVADRLAAALELAQLREDAAERLDRLNAVQSIVLGLRSAQDLDLTLQIVVERTTAALRVDASTVLVIDETTNELVLAAGAGFIATSPASRLPLDDPVLNQAIGMRGLIDLRVPGEVSLGRRRSAFAREAFEAYGAVAVVARGKWLGVLEVFNRSAVGVDGEWLSFLELIGGLAAVAVDSGTQRRRSGGAADDRRPRLQPNFTASELRILKLVVDGFTNREIASQLNASESTVKSAIRRMLDRTGATNRTDLTRQALRKNWL